MGHYAYLFVAGFVIAFAVLAIGMRGDTRIAETDTAKIQYKQEARDASHAGLSLTMRRIVMDEGDWSGASIYGMDSTAYELASFRTIVTPVGADTLDITSIGRKQYLNRRGEFVDTTHTIDVRIIRTQLAGGPPPAWKYSIVTDDDLDLGGNMLVAAYDEGMNADVHTNGMLEGNQKAKKGQKGVEGFGSFTTGTTASESFYDPVIDRNGDEANVVHQDSIHVPVIDIELLESHARNGRGVFFSDPIDFTESGLPYSSFEQWASAVGGDAGVGASAESPFIVFGDKGISFSNQHPIELSGFGVFVSNGSMHINKGDILGVVGTGEHGEPVSQMALFINGDLHLNGNTSVTATVLTSGSFNKGNGTATLTGGIWAHGIGDLRGTFTVIWAGPNDGLLQYLGGSTEILGPTIASWAEW